MEQSETLIDKLLSAASEASDKGHNDEAESLFKKAVEQAEMLPGPPTKELGQALFLFATYYEQLGRRAEAQALLDRSRPILARHRGKSIRDTISMDD